MASPADITLADAGQLIDAAGRVALASHTRPDGDAIGSALALGLVLAELGKPTLILNQDAVPKRYAFLPGIDRITGPDALDHAPAPDLFIALDTGAKVRIGKEIWDRLDASATPTLVIDHHVSNERYGKFNHVDPSSPATGQIVFELICQMEWPLPASACESLWAAIVTDTGSFQYPSTTERTLEIAAELIRHGVDPGRMTTAIYQSYPQRRLLLLRELLNRMQFTANGRIAHWTLPLGLTAELGIEPEDHDGLIDHLRAVDTVLGAVSFEAATDGSIRISARSKDAEKLDVAKVCGEFGGGGHRLAAGARVEGDLESVARRFVSRLEDCLNHGND